jgi:hypothetical protein
MIPGTEPALRFASCLTTSRRLTACATLVIRVAPAARPVQADSLRYWAGVAPAARPVQADSLRYWAGVAPAARPVQADSLCYPCQLCSAGRQAGTG